MEDNEELKTISQAYLNAKIEEYEREKYKNFIDIIKKQETKLQQIREYCEKAIKSDKLGLDIVSTDESKAILNTQIRTCRYILEILNSGGAE